MKIYTRYNVPSVPGVTNNSPSMTQQQFKDECNIDNIISKFQVTGILGDPFAPQREPIFGDFVNVPNFQEAQELIVRAGEDFMTLSSDVRKRFDNDPIKFLEFMSDSSNADEAVKLGLAVKENLQNSVQSDIVNLEQPAE